MEVYIARDFAAQEEEVGELYIYNKKPTYNDTSEIFMSNGIPHMKLDSDVAPQVKEGECYRCTLEIDDLRLEETHRICRFT